MKTGLKFINTKTIKEGTTTVVLMTATVDLTKIRAFSVIRQIPMMEECLGLTHDIYNEGQLLIKGEGKSRCHPDDLYDEKTGFYIAQTRASLEIAKKYKEFLNSVLTIIEKYFMNDLYELNATVTDMYYKLDDHLELDLNVK